MTEANLIAGRYEQLELIGEGGMGEVYRGRDTLTGQMLAIKSLKADVFKQDPEIIQRFEREGDALRKLNHPSIVKVLDSIKENNAHYLILEYVKGGSLRDKLDETPQLPLRQILEIALDLADALARAHRLNIIHRDLKPANVLIADDGTPRLTDFGVARIDDASQVTKTGVVMGTLAYLPPEALAGDRIDHRADIWAFGVMLYEMLAGRRPFDGDNAGAVIAAILQKEPPDLFELRPYTDEPLLGFFEGVIYWMLEKDRDKRPDSFRLIGAIIEDLLSGKETKLSWQLKKADTNADSSISTSEAVALAREYGSEVYKQTDLENAPTTPAGLSVKQESQPTPPRMDLPVKSKRRIKGFPRVFLSYRREDSIAITGRLYDRLSDAIGDENVFKDMEDIPVGSDFKQVLEAEIQASDVVLAIIGKKWLNASNAAGRRLEDPSDFVRIELESALKNEHCIVIPVLVDNAEMPEARLLPPGMKSLIYRNAAPVRNDPDFNRDSEWLIQQILNSFELEKSAFPFRRFAMAAIWVLLIILTIAIGSLFMNSQNRAEPILIEPIPEGEYMVLVAQPDFIAGTERNVQASIIRDLEENLAAVSYSRIHIRAYPAIIRSEDEAQRIAEAFNAHVILWGNYDEQQIEMNVQLGDLSLFPNVQFPREQITRFSDAIYRLTDERRETLAFGVIAVFNAVHPMSNEPIEMARNILIYDLITESSATVMGNGINSYYHRYILFYASDTEAALNELNRAINDVEPHAFLHLARSLAYQSLNRFQESQRDIRIAEQLAANPNWLMPKFSLVNIAVFFEEDYTKALEIFPNNFETAAAGNWVYPNYRGILRYFTGDFEGARSDIELSLSQNPTLSAPYAIATSLAFRDSDIIEARAIFDDMLIRFPDARLTERVLMATFNPSVADGTTLSYFSAFAALIPGDWETILEDTQNIIDRGFHNPDIYLLKGFAHCNLGQYPEAEAAYNSGIELDTNLLILYALRAEARYRQGLLRLADAQTDIDVILGSGQNQFVPLVPALLTGDYGCDKFFTYDFATAIETTQEANP